MTGSTPTTRITRRGALRALMLACPLALGLTATPARADSPLDFTLRNRVGVTIREVYVKPHQVESWEEDVLGSSVLRDGQNTTIRFGPGQERRGDLWDVRIVTSDGRDYVWTRPGFRLREISEITIYLQNGVPTADSR